VPKYGGTVDAIVVSEVPDLFPILNKLEIKEIYLQTCSQSFEVNGPGLKILTKP